MKNMTMFLANAKVIKSIYLLFGESSTDNIEMGTFYSYFIVKKFFKTT